MGVPHTGDLGRLNRGYQPYFCLYLVVKVQKPTESLVGVTPGTRPYATQTSYLLQGTE
jgi:hypothetical protein